MATKGKVQFENVKAEETLVWLRAVTKQFPGNPLPTLDCVDYEIFPEKIHTILGFSGGGKSVTLKMILGLLKADSGQIRVLGQDMSKLEGNALNSLRRRFGMLFQGAALFDSLTVFDNVAFPLRECRKDWGEEKISLRVKELLDQVELDLAAQKMPSELSGGMKKRVAMARAIALEPDLLLFDEPTTGLDPVTSEIIDDLIVDTTRKLAAGALIISHNIHAALRISDFVSMIVDGKIIERGTPSQFVESEDPRVRRFLKSAGVL